MQSVQLTWQCHATRQIPVLAKDELPTTQHQIDVREDTNNPAERRIYVLSRQKDSSLAHMVNIML